MSDTYTHEEAVAALQKVAKRWPKSLWLFSASGILCVMEKDFTGQRLMDGLIVDASAKVATIDIENDGGDW